MNVGHGIADDVPQYIEADEIRQAEGRHLWPADGRAGQRVHFLDAEVHLLHQAHDVQCGKGADAIGDEVRRVLGVNHTLAQPQVAEVRDGLHGGGVGVGSGDEFQQPHIAGRVEEVSAKPVAAKLVGEPFDNFGHGQAAGVGSDDGSRLANGFDAAQQAALDVQILDHSFNDPVHISELLQIVFEVADGDQLREGRLEERGGLGLDRSLQSGGSDAVPYRAIGIRGNDVQQVRRNTGIGQVRGDAGTHGARAQDGNFLNPSRHECFATPALEARSYCTTSGTAQAAPIENIIFLRTFAE